jgi:hypothetical protein
MSETAGYRISAAGLLLTYWCNARCDHCYELSGPERRGWMSVEAARRHWAALKRLGADAAGLHVGGGEPFGDFERLVAVVRAAREAGLEGVGYVETNGFWATDDGLVRERLAELREAGLRQISISCDVFHQAYVDPAGPQRLWRVGGEVLGEAGVRARRWRFLQSPRDLRSATAEEREAAYREALAAHPERMTGRAAGRLARLLPRWPAEKFSDERCGENPSDRVPHLVPAGSIAGQGVRHSSHPAPEQPGARVWHPGTNSPSAGLEDSGHVHVDPAGWVFPGTCAGILLGRADEGTALDEVLARPAGEVRRVLAARGPWGLREELALPLGYKDEPEGYADKCHLCTSVRTFLFRTGKFAAELGPREVYEEE